MTMKQVNVTKTTGPALNYLVAVCEEMLGLDNADAFLRDHKIGFSTRYSTNWSVGGPIIEREGISLRKWQFDCSGWIAILVVDGKAREEIGPTPLIAAMRCYVASKLGDTSEVPEELV